jgi:small subunit ribosomal protein S17e
LDKVRRVSELLVQKYPDLFTDDFAKNKEALGTVALIRAKFMRNQIAGYITRLKTVYEEEKKEEEAASAE